MTHLTRILVLGDIDESEQSPSYYFVASGDGKLACPICENVSYVQCPHSVNEMREHLLSEHAQETATGAALDAIASCITQRGYVNGRLETDEELRTRLQAPARIPTIREAWFDMYLSNDKQARKQAPLARGLAGYFPNACVHVAHVSFVANEQHNPGLPLQWAFDKSSDEPDCEIRHMLDAMGASAFDDDGLLHRAKKAWRALADLERFVLMHYPKAQPGASVTGFTREPQASAQQKAEK